VKPVFKPFQNEDFDQSLPLDSSLFTAQKRTLQSKLAKHDHWFWPLTGVRQFSSEFSKITFDKLMFATAWNVVISHPIKNRDIRYTLDGSNPIAWLVQSIWAQFGSKKQTIRPKYLQRLDWSPEANYQFLEIVWLLQNIPTFLSTPNKQYKVMDGNTIRNQRTKLITRLANGSASKMKRWNWRLKLDA